MDNVHEVEDLRLKMRTMQNADNLSFEKAPRYKKNQPVLAQMLPVEVTFKHDWGDQIMAPGSILITDPETSTCWGCENNTFAQTYEAIPSMPGFYRKVALVQALQLSEAFYVSAIDKQSRPEFGVPGDYVVRTIRSDGREDRYLIHEQDFERMYVLVD